jgi:hypothetical protein
MTRGMLASFHIQPAEFLCYTGRSSREVAKRTPAWTEAVLLDREDRYVSTMTHVNSHMAN